MAKAALWPWRKGERVVRRRPCGTSAVDFDRWRDLRLEPLERRDLLAAIQIGDVVQGEISGPGEVDEYTFWADEDDVVILSLATPWSPDFWGILDFEGPQGPLDGTIQGGMRKYTLPDTGKYTIRIHDDGYDDTGTYALALEGITPPSLDAVPIQIGEVKSGTIGEMGEADAYTFSAEVDDVVVISMGPPPGSFWPQGRLYDPSGDYVGIIQAGGDSKFTLPETGTYEILVRDNGIDDTGAYGLALEGINPPSPDAVSLQIGEVTSGAIDQLGEVDAYTFTGAINDVVHLSLGAPYMGTFWAFAELYAPSGDHVGPIRASGNSKFTLAEDGTYVILVYDNGYNETGSYSLIVEGINPPSPDAVALQFGVIQSGTIGQLADVDAYHFTGTADSLVTLAVGGPSWPHLGPRADLFAPSGDKVGSVIASFDKDFTLPESGTYVILVYDNSHDEWPWDYTVKVGAANNTIGVFYPDAGGWYLRNSNSGGAPDFAFAFGGPGWVPLSGDWNADSVDTIGVFYPDAGNWYLRNSNSGGAPDYAIGFGFPGVVPVTGDWNNDDTDTIGIYHPNGGSWYLRDSLAGGVPDYAIGFGFPGTIPVTGDWNGDGVDTIGLYHPAGGSWYLRDSLAGGSPDYAIGFGFPGTIPVVGDWNGDGTDTIGLYHAASGSWYLRDSLSGGAPDYAIGFGFPGTIPVTGNWSSALHAVEAAAPGAEAVPITDADLVPIVDEAIARWTDAGVDTSALSIVDVIVQDLSGDLLGLASGHHVVIDADAAGHGWFVDATPWDDVEFGRIDRTGQITALPEGPAANRIDLLTAVMHELGHVFGFGDEDGGPDSNDLMNGWLDTGVRRATIASPLDGVFADTSWQDELPR